MTCADKAGVSPGGSDIIGIAEVTGQGVVNVVVVLVTVVIVVL